MTPERWKRVEQLYHTALAREGSQRASYLAEACAGDEELCREVESLLGNEEQADSFLDGHALEAAARGYVSAVVPDLSGKKLGRYEVIGRLGAGGMGEVYKARDTRLKREVALKVLPPERMADQGRRRRFEQEARAASALNHPNIITIHDIDRAEGTDFIAMEYVPGKTLAKLIGRKSLSLDEALKYAVQIADALAAAHGAGIVHRDLKPANIMVNDVGQVKVLDFGLAKLAERGPEGTAAEEAGSAQTMLSETETGTILGTVAYMSPEQAEGKKVDARSDIFSFGAVLYEMVTGKRAFQRDSTASTLAAILKEEPKTASQAVEGLPRDVDRIIKRCLRKDPAQRFQHMSDLKVDLEELKRESDSGVLEATGAPKPRSRRRLLWAVGVALVLAAAAIGVWVVRSKTGAPEADLVAVPLTTYPGTEDHPSFSPDGTQVAFQWCPKDPGKSCQIYIKQLGVEPPVRLTDNPAISISPAWSPDGRTIAFLRRLSRNATSFSLVLIPQRGGRERVLAEVDVFKAGEFLYGPHLAWTPDSKWLVCAAPDARNKPWSLYLFSVEMGEKRKLTNTPAGLVGGDTAPAFSPDGRLLAFTRVSDAGPGADLYLLRLGEGYRPLGEAERVRTDSGWFSLGAAWMPDGGEIVFASHAGLCRMALFKPATLRRLPFAPDDASAPAISRQGNRLAYSVGRFNANIWRIDLREPGHKPGAPAPFISSSRWEGNPAYSPDGNRIAFLSTRSGSVEIWVCDAGGSNAVQLTSFGGPVVQGPRWSPDSQNIVFQAEPGRNPDIYVISAVGGPPRRLTTEPSVDTWPYWSHDGRWIYFESDRGGTQQIWKVPAGGGEAIQITRNGGNGPQESADGKWLYYHKGWPAPVIVWRMPIDGGEETKILGEVLPCGGFTLGKEGIYFCTAPDKQGHKDLSIYDFATGKTRKILTIERQLGLGLAVSPDDRTILYSQLDEAGSDLMLVENFR